MPYIKQSERTSLKTIETSGKLNYLFTTLVNQYMNEHGLSYQTINDITGALEGCKLEFTRRVTVPYENSKLSENGDVYGKSE